MSLLWHIIYGVYDSQDRRQSKTLLTIDEHGSKIARNSVFNCHLLLVGRQMQSKTLVLTIFYLRSLIVLTFSIAAYLVCDCSGWVSSVYGFLKFKTLLIVACQNSKQGRP